MRKHQQFTNRLYGRLPDNVSLEEGALVEPLSVGVHACRKASVQLGSNVLVTGAGPIGIVTLFVAKAMGAKRVVVTGNGVVRKNHFGSFWDRNKKKFSADIQERRLALAEKFGADCTLLVKPREDVSETAAKIRSLLGGDAPDKTIDCSGFESSVRLAVEVTKPGGVVVLVGMGAEEMNVSLTPAIVKEIRILGSFRYANE